ncbi:MAG: hypothetical protein IJD79_10415, partial [Clostridia bacterium]|nr:hypothetical protein [Clostridia bacterium]
SVEKTGTNGLVDTYTITFSDGTTTTFTVTNGADGVDGEDGKDGANGQNGTDGKDGINGTDGKDGADGANGKDGESVTVTEVKKIATEGLVDTYVIIFSDGTTTTFTVTNGADGVDGEDGKDGADGKDGTDGKDGLDGKDGINGKDGVDGKDADSTTIFERIIAWLTKFFESIGLAFKSDSE